jgi:hypothetical protein
VGGDMSNNFAYGNSLLLLYVSKENENHEECGAIQVYVVTSRKCVREMSIAAKKKYHKSEQEVGFNSKVMVVFEKPSDFLSPRKMNIYDLEAIKNPNSSADELLVHTLAVDFYCSKIMVTETEIFSLGWKTIGILNFSSFDAFQNTAKSTTLSLPWRSVAE